ncbi:peptidyl-prolyl cis-trans isomerase [Blattabacterium cuenoti]|uniref:peptidyl-prolyl cis-trans isomerase n=1 Tax=Blattabacterium cuenoti TaxID=1653831 RepID=UPI00163B6FA6|nr:peptidyl-prolyl cis-trans isomerase [Blattabacterium cuenoti]
MKFLIKKFIKEISLIALIIFYIFINNTLIYSREKIGGIFAIVGDEIILDSDIKSQTENKIEEKFKICENFLFQKLMIFHGKKNFKEKENDLQLNNENLASVSKNIKNHDNDENNINKYNKNKDILYIKSLYKKITDDIEVSPEEVKYFFIKNKNRLYNTPKKYLVSYIVFYPKKDKKNKDKIINFLYEVKIKDSFDCKKFKNKNLPFICNEEYVKGIKINSISEEYRNIILSLKEQEIFGPFETEMGYHLIKLENRKGNKIDLRNFFIKKEYSSSELLKTKIFASSIRKGLMLNIIDFDKIYLINNDIADINLKKQILINENQCFKDLKQVLNFGKKGNITDLYEGKFKNKNVFFIIKILDIIDSRPISIKEDFSYLENFVKEKKKNEKLNNWRKKEFKKTYIKVNY